MKKAKNDLVVKVERTILAPVGEVFKAWLNPKVPGTPWYENDKLIFQPKVDGLFYWLISGNKHYGRFTKIEKPGRIQHTWMSKWTKGEESLVTLTFKKKGKDTLMTLTHSGLPDDDGGRSHEDGWNYFMDKFTKTFAGKRK